MAILQLRMGPESTAARGTRPAPEYRCREDAADLAGVPRKSKPAESCGRPDINFSESL
jgi:hypothetical protein